MSYKKLKEEEEELLERDYDTDIKNDKLGGELTNEDGDGKTPSPDSPDGLTEYHTTVFGGQELGEYEGPESQPLVEEKEEFEGGLIDDEDHLRSGLGVLHQESKKLRYLRRVLAAASFVLLGLLLAAAIFLIAFSPSCEGEVATGGLPWWKHTIIYQCYPQSFQDSDGDGVGDFKGIESRVDYFVDLGVQTVWFNPIYCSPRKDNGYDVSNYTAINPLFGTLADFKSLLGELHKRGIKVLLDFVPNHTSKKHPWFQDSKSSRNSSKREWYVWADPVDGGPPNNWISVFGGSAWTFDNLTGQYYLHQFSEFQPDLNYHNSDVITAMEEVLKYWLGLGVDGFRVDAAQFLVEDLQLRNESRNPDFHGPEDCTTNISSADCYNSLIHNRTTNVHPIHSIIQSWRAILDNSSDRFMVGEVYNDIETVMSYYGPDLNEFNFPFNFFLLENNDWTGTAVSAIVSKWLDYMPPGAWPNWVLGNHDNSRIASKAGVRLARALNVLLLTLPGTPTTYYGEEIMMTDVYVPPPERKDLYGDRDKERTPMQWNTKANAGFTDGKPWLPLPDNYTKVNVFVESTNDTSMLSLYEKLSKIRSEHNALLYSNYSLVLNTTDTYAYLRFHTSTTEQFLVVINFSEKPVKLDLKVHMPITLDNPQIVLSSNLNRTGEIDLKSVEVMAGEAMLVKGQNC